MSSFVSIPPQSLAGGPLSSSAHSAGAHYSSPNVANINSSSSSNSNGAFSFQFNPAALPPQVQQVLNLPVFRTAAPVRPWRDFFDRTRFSKPTGWDGANARFAHNTQYFRSNYAIIVGALLLYCLITNLTLLASLVFISLAYYWITIQPAGRPVIINNQEFTHRTLLIILAVVSIPLLWIASAGSTIFFIVGASVLAVGGHAVFCEPGIENDFGANVV